MNLSRPTWGASHRNGALQSLTHGSREGVATTLYSVSVPVATAVNGTRTGSVSTV